MSINLLDLLRKYQSVRLNEEANNWKEAVYVSIKPLLEKSVITNEYYDAIIENTIQYGPYYIIADNLAMPHAQSNAGVNENGFSLVTLKNEIYFENDPRPIRLLIALAATSAEIHTSEALPQIVAVFEDEKTVEKIINSKTIEEVYSIIESIDFTKYLSK